MHIAIVGAGPAGLFCAYNLVGKHDVTIFDKGQPLKFRECFAEVAGLGRLQCLQCPNNQSCSCLCGEGGAGGWSDGKITLSIGRGVQNEHIFARDPFKEKLKQVDELICHYGGQGQYSGPVQRPSFLSGSKFTFDSYPLRYMGTEGIRTTIHNLVLDLERQGARFEWGQTVEGIRGLKNGAFVVESNPPVVFDKVVIATGLYDIDWLLKLAYSFGLRLSPGPAGIGIRLEAPNEVLQPMLDVFYDFKLSLKAPTAWPKDQQLDFRSFCVNSSGHVVNECHPDYISVNGRADSSETGRSNLAILAKIPSTPLLDAKALVRQWAHNALVGGLPIVQSAIGFMAGSGAEYLPRLPITNPATVKGRLDLLWPDALWRGLVDYLCEFEEIAPRSVISPESVVYGPEIKYHGYSWPLLRGYEVLGKPDLHVIGNAAGFTDSFSTAAVMGLVCGQNISAGGE